MAKKTSRPGRTLFIFFLCIAALYGLAALGGTWKPQLGLDLSGGTRITLQATNSSIDPTKLRQAASIISQRVNGSGVVEAQVTTQGSRNIVVEIPGKNRQDLVDAVKRTAQLRFRLVSGQALNGRPATSTPTATPTGKATGTATPTATPTSKATATATGTATATPKPRPAPEFAGAAKPKAKKTSTATPTPTPTATPTATPQTSPGASIDDPLKWVLNPGTAWQLKLAEYVCPPPGSTAPIPDDPNQPMVACTADGAKLLLSKAVIEGTELSSASYGTDQQGLGWEVDLSLKSGARKTFADISTALHANGGQFAMVLDGQVIQYAGFTSAILDGNARITGSFTESEARSLANSLKYGALPVKFDPNVRVETIGATLASNQLDAGILAGIIAMIIVMIYCLIYYRGLGSVVVTSLIVAGAITYGTVLVLAKAAGFTLTLPGIAGLIVAVGITADSFIVYFERIRDEMRSGKSMRVAVEAGWIRARNTCLAADTVSLLAAVVLYIFAIGVVRGFAFALGISTLIDLVVFFWFTKPAITFMARRPYFNNGEKWSGLSPETLGIDAPGAVHTLAGGQA